MISKETLGGGGGVTTRKSSDLDLDNNVKKKGVGLLHIVRTRGNWGPEG